MGCGTSACSGVHGRRNEYDLDNSHHAHDGSPVKRGDSLLAGIPAMQDMVPSLAVSNIKGAAVSLPLTAENIDLIQGSHDKTQTRRMMTENDDPNLEGDDAVDLEERRRAFRRMFKRVRSWAQHVEAPVGSPNDADGELTMIQ